MTQLAIDGGEPIRTKPFPSWPQAEGTENDLIKKVLDSHRWFAGLQGDDPDTLGTLFGQRFADLHKARFGLPVANGSVAIEIALRALGIKPGDEVIVPAYSFISTATSVLMVGAVPVFADIDPQSYCLDLHDVARRITPHTRAIVPVHLAGHPADMHGLLKLADQHNLSVIEDCAQAIDTKLGAKKVGTWGDLGTFSFQSNKTITCGEGGLIMAMDPDLAEKVIALRAFGRYRDKKVERSSDLTCQQVSSNYRLSEFQSAVLLSQLEKFAGEDTRRIENAAYLSTAIEKMPGIHHIRQTSIEMKHSYYYYLIRYTPADFADIYPETLCRALNAEGIPFVVGDRQPLYAHPVFKADNLKDFLSRKAFERHCQSTIEGDVTCPEVEKACQCTLILRHQVLLGNRQDMDDIITALWKIIDNIQELTA
jgi:dTDP-4-amino-4,6-dideoxygalactose transaminase